MRDIEASLRHALRTTAETYEPADMAEAERVFVRKRSRRRVFRTAGAGILVAASVVGVFALAQPEVINDREPRPQPAGLQVAARLDVPAEPLAIAGDVDAVWVASREAGMVSRIDPSSGDTAQVELEGASQVVMTADDVWAAGSDRVLEIDSQSTRLGTMVIDWPDVVDMAAAADGEGPVWLVTSSGCVADVTTLPEPMCVDPSDFHATDVAASSKETWLLDGRTGALLQLHAPGDVNEDRAVFDHENRLPVAPSGRYADLLLSTIEGREVLWASGEGGRVLRLDLRTGDATTVRLGGDYVDLAEGYGGVWGLVGHEGRERGDVVQLDIDTAEPEGTAIALSGKPSDLVAVDDGIWVTLRDANQLVRIAQPES